MIDIQHMRAKAKCGASVSLPNSPLLGAIIVM